MTGKLLGHSWMLNGSRDGLAAATLVMLSPALAHAHTGAGAVAGVLAGLEHPVSGLDHVCAMVAVGLWAAQCGGTATWFVPLVFLGVLAVGGATGIAGVAIPLVEPGIVASVLVLGLLIAAAMRLPMSASALIVGLFALLHGHAHGNEMPATVAGAAYAAGFLASSAGLVLVGVGLGRGMQLFGSAQLVRYVGGAIAVCGLYLCVV